MDIWQKKRKREIKMKLKYIGETDVSLTAGEEYNVLSVEHGYYRIIDNTNEDYLFPPEEFKIISEE